MKDATLNFIARRGFATGSGLLVLTALGLLAVVRMGHPLDSLGEWLIGGGFLLGSALVIAGAYAERPPVPPMTVALPSRPVAPAPPPTAANEVPAHLEKTLAEIAVLAWKIDKRAQKEPNPPKPILRNAARIIEMLGEHKVEVVSYEGRKIDMGSRVEVQEAVEGVEEDKVVAQHEPEIQVNGKLVRKALLSVGKGIANEKPMPAAQPASVEKNESNKPKTNEPQ